MNNEFITFFNNNQAALNAWGEHIVNVVKMNLENIVDLKELPNFLKIESMPRLKTLESALGKIGRKGYNNPIEQMTDLVGTRFVVLLSQHIATIVDIIESNKEWDVKMSKDFKAEIAKNPKLFDYQSQHYEIRPKEETSLNGVLISKDICCEVQIRTLLQHAYAELVHDSIYKPVSSKIPSDAERSVARSMALMETTDQLFCQTMDILKTANESRNELLVALEKVYFKYFPNAASAAIDEITNLFILDEYRDFYNKDIDIENEIDCLLQSKAFITSKVNRRLKDRPFFSQPASLFIYWLVSKENTDKICDLWPLPGFRSDLTSILTDLDKRPFHE